MARRKPITTKGTKKKVVKKKIDQQRVSTTRRTKTPRSRTIRVHKKSAVIFSAPSGFFEQLSQKFLAAKSVAQSFVQNGLAKFQKNQKAFQKRIVRQKKSFQKQVKTVQKLRRQWLKQTPLRFPKINLPTLTFPKIKLPQLPKLFSKKKKKIAKKKVTPPSKRKPSLLRRFLHGVWQECVHPFVWLFRYHLLATLLSIALSVLILGSAYEVYDIAFKDLPSVDNLMQRKQILTTKILDRNGKVLYRIYKDENRTLIPLNRVPADVVHATIAIEDQNFYEHRGISIRGIVRAIRNTLTGKRLEGGSTITQQLVKDTLLTPERTFKRKVREILLAFLVEGAYTKDEILEMYFNEVPYGGSTYGIEEASERYFGKSASQLTLAESAFLAGLPEAPSVYSPFGPNPDLAYSRQHDVLRRMVEDGYITQEQAGKAKAEKLNFQSDTTDIQAPHFVMFVRSLLANQYGEDVVNQGGLEVRTTLDLNTQNQAQEIVTKEVDNLAHLHISNGSAMITNPKTGEVLSMVGSKNYFDFAHDGEVNVALRPRQPGSSIKPVTYSVALEKGETPYTTIVDEPITFNIPGSAPYSPKNYDGKFHGTVTLREALASSYNIPAVKTLASIGIPNMIDKAESYGISTWKDRSRFGLSLTLGSGEVLMYDMMQVYGTLANGGNTVTLNPILEIKDSHGNVLYHNSCALDNTNCPKRRTLDPKVAYELTDVLSDNNARTPAFGPHSVLYIPGQQVAVKTGTTNNLKDNWAFGYTNDRVVATWVGNDDGSPMSYVASGITGASPIWNKIMLTQLDANHPNTFSPPDGYVKVTVCTRTGTLPCSGCPSVHDELFAPGTEPKVACDPAQFAPKPSPVPGVSNLPGMPSVDKILQGVQIGN